MAEIAAAGCSAPSASDQQDNAFQQTSTSIRMITPNEIRHNAVSAVLSRDPPGKQSHAAVFGIRNGAAYSHVQER